MVELDPVGRKWGGLFDLEKALLMRPDNAHAPSRSALKKLAEMIQERQADLKLQSIPSIVRRKPAATG
jgi:hypothetical protein